MKNRSVRNRRFSHAAAVVFILAVLCALCGCSLTKSLATGNPLWYYRTGVRGENIYFVGEATAPTRRQAELLAYQDIIDKLSSYLGEEPERTAYRELTTTGAIERYGLVVDNTFSSTEEDGSVRIMIRAAGTANILDSFRSTEAVELGRRISQVESYVLEGDEYIKNGMDLEGVRSYIKSITVSGSIDNRNLEKEYRSSAILDEVLYILKRVRLEISGFNSRPSCDGRRIVL